MEQNNKKYLFPALTAFFSLYWVGGGFHEVYFSLFLTEKGLSGTQIGLLFYMLYMVTILGAFAIGYVSDKFRTVRKVILVLMLGTAVFSWVLKFGEGFFMLSLLSILYGFFFASPPDLADRVIYDNGLGRRYGIIHMGGSIGYFIGSLLSGVVLTAFGTGALFDCACISFILCVLSALFFPKDGDFAGSGTGEKTQKKRKGDKVPVGVIFKNPKAYFIYSVLILWGLLEVAALNYSSVYIVHMGKDAGLNAPLTAAAMVGQVIAYSNSNRIINKIGNVNAMWSSYLLMGVRTLGITLVPFAPFWLCLLMCVIGGMGHPIKLCGCVNMIVEEFPKEVSSLAQTLKNLAHAGVGSSIGAILMGILIDRFDFAVLYFWLAAASVMGGILFLFWGRLVKKRSN